MADRKKTVVNGGSPGPKPGVYGRSSSGSKIATGDGFVLFLIGSGVFVLEWLLNLLQYSIPFSFKIGIGLGLALLASSEVFDNKGFLFSLFAILGFFGLVQTGNVFPLWAAVIAFVIWGIVSHGSNAEVWFQNELTAGLILIGFFLGSTDLILYFFSGAGSFPLIGSFELPLTETARNLLSTLPFWVLLGAFTVDEDKHNGFFVGLSRFVFLLGILYIAFSVGFSSMPGYGYEVSVDDISDIRDDVNEQREQVSDSGESVLWSQYKCFRTNLGDPKSINDCVENRQARSKCEQFLKSDIPKGENERYQQCLRRVKGESVDVGGSVGRFASEPTEFSVSENSDFPYDSVRSTSSVPFELMVSSPRDSINLEVDCYFLVDDGRVKGEVSQPSFSFEEGSSERSLLCDPVSSLPEGRSELVVDVLAKDMVTTSILERGFVWSGMSDEEKDSQRSGEFGDAGESKAQNEFARIDFQIGSPRSDPLIEDGEKPKLFAYVNNVRKGNLTNVRRAEIDLGKDDFSVSDCSFREEENSLVKDSFSFNSLQAGSKVPLSVCEFSVNPGFYEGLSAVNFLEKVVFEARLSYDYKVSESFDISVRGD